LIYIRSAAAEARRISISDGKAVWSGGHDILGSNCYFAAGSTRYRRQKRVDPELHHWPRKAARLALAALSPRERLLAHIIKVLWQLRQIDGWPRRPQRLGRSTAINPMLIATEEP
jgi:hypothetical protein